MSLDKIILGYCMKAKQYIARCVSELDAKQFVEDYSLIFHIFKRHYDAHNRYPSLNVFEDCLEQKEVEVEKVVNCMGLYNEIKLEAKDLAATDFDYYLQKIKEREIELRWTGLIDGTATDRKGEAIPSLDDLMRSDPRKALDVILKEVGYKIDKLTSDKNMKRGYIDELIEGVYSEYEQVKKNPELAYGLKTGFDILDNETLGMRPGEMWVVSGPTAGGKSIFLLNVAINAYLSGKNVMLFSLEVDLRSYMQRFAAAYCDIPQRGIAMGNLTPEQEKHFRTSMEKLKSDKSHYLSILDIPNATVLTINAEISRALSEREVLPDLIIVDYLGIMKVSGKSRTDWEEQNEACAKLRESARVYGIPVFTAVQLNRDKKKAKGVDRVARAAGIAHNSDIVLQIEEKDDEEKTSAIEALDDTMGLFFSKNRKGKQHFTFRLWKDFGNMKLKNRDETAIHSSVNETAKRAANDLEGVQKDINKSVGDSEVSIDKKIIDSKKNDKDDEQYGQETSQV